MYFCSLLWPLGCRKASPVFKLPSFHLLEESAPSIKHVYLTHSYTHPSKQDGACQSPWRSSQVCLSFPVLSLSRQGLLFVSAVPMKQFAVFVWVLVMWLNGSSHANKWNTFIISTIFPCSGAMKLTTGSFMCACLILVHCYLFFFPQFGLCSWIFSHISHVLKQ